jgi:hypothetical protein
MTCNKSLIMATNGTGEADAQALKEPVGAGLNTQTTLCSARTAFGNNRQAKSSCTGRAGQQKKDQDSKTSFLSRWPFKEAQVVPFEVKIDS